jgi:hypothetical protein
MVLKFGHFGKQIRNTWEALKCGVGEGWRILVGLLMWKSRSITSSRRGKEYPT